VCQAVIAAGVPWPHFYFGSLVLSALNIIFVLCVFSATQAEFDKDRRTALEGVTRESSRQSLTKESFDAADHKSSWEGEVEKASPFNADAPTPANSGLAATGRYKDSEPPDRSFLSRMFEAVPMGILSLLLGLLREVCDFSSSFLLRCFSTFRDPQRDDHNRFRKSRLVVSNHAHLLASLLLSTVDRDILANHKGEYTFTSSNIPLNGNQDANSHTVGYIISGLWAGMSISRFLWGYYTPPCVGSLCHFLCSSWSRDHQDKPQT
jgi:hypothetical protein